MQIGWQGMETWKVRGQQMTPIMARERNVLPFIIIGALVVAGLLAGGDNCYQPVPEAPEGGC